MVPVSKRPTSLLRPQAGSLMLAVLMVSLLFKILLITGTPFSSGLDCRIWGFDSNVIEQASKRLYSVINPMEFRDDARPPGYHLFVGLVRELFGESLFPGSLWVLQLVLTTLMAYVIYLIAGEMYGSRAAVIAGFIAAFYPAFTFYSFMVLTDLFFVIFMAFVFHRMVVQPRLNSMRNTLLTGFLVGLWAMVRVVPLLLIPGFALWFAWLQRRNGKAAVRHFIAFVLVSMIIVAPWSAAMSVRYHRVVLITPKGMARPMIQGAVMPDFEFIEGKVVDFMSLDGEKTSFTRACKMANKSDCGLTSGGMVGKVSTLVGFAIENPMWALARFCKKFRYLFSPHEFPLKVIRFGCDVRPDTIFFAYLAESLAYWLVLALSLAGFGTLDLKKPSPQEVLIVFFSAYVIATSCLTLGMARYKLPIEPFMIIFAAKALGNPREAVRRMLKPSLKNLIILAAAIYFSAFMAKQIIFMAGLYRIHLY